MAEEFDVVVIGSGPGGYVAGIRAGQLGLKTAVVEKSEIGGVCLNWGCIPSKALLKNAEVLSLFHKSAEFGISFDNLTADFSKSVERSRDVVDKLTKGVAFLLRKNNVEVVNGEAKFKTPNTIEVGDTRTLTAKNIIVATGASPRSIPPLPIDGETVITSRNALELDDLPETVAIVGGGATGAEFSYLYNAYGVDVTLIEALPNILPNEDLDISVELEKSFSKQGIKIMTGSMVNQMSKNGNRAVLEVLQGDEKAAVEVDKVLVCVGVQANTEGIGLEEVGVELEKGFIQIDDRMATNIDGIFAIGDVTGELLLAHAASAQAVSCVEHIAGVENPPLDYQKIPRATYCHPQVTSFGITEQQAKEAGISYKVGKFPFTASGKAIAIGDTEGLAKVVVDSEYGEILGAHLIGPDVTEILGELLITNLLEGTVSEVGWLPHAHPTISEVLKEAVLDSKGEAIHI